MPDDPNDDKIAAYIKRTVDAAPELTDDQRNKISALLRTGRRPDSEADS